MLKQLENLLSFDHHEKWHGNEHAWMIMIHYLLLINLHVCNMTPSKIKHNVSVCCLTIMSVYFIDCINLFFKLYLLLIWLVPKLSHPIGGLFLSHLIGQHFDCKSSLDMNIFTKDFWDKNGHFCATNITNG